MCDRTDGDAGTPPGRAARQRSGTSAAGGGWDWAPARLSRGPQSGETARPRPSVTVRQPSHPKPAAGLATPLRVGRRPAGVTLSLLLLGHFPPDVTLR